MDCSDVGRVPPVATGRLHTEEGVVLLAYIGTIILLLFGPPSLCHRCWRNGRRPPWFLDKTVYAPVIGVVYLSIINLLRGKTTSLVTGTILKEVFLNKYDIILLIQSFAYLSISLDISGFFRRSAVFIVVAAKGNGYRLLVYLYILCSILTYFTSNDIVIISMTPIIIHVGSLAEIKNVIPLLITQFIAANTAAMGMLIGSPTNIILGDAVHLTFSRYWVLMLLPTTVAIITTLLMCQAVFIWFPTRGNHVQATFSPLTDSQPLDALGEETTSPSVVEADDVRLTSVESGTKPSEPPPVLEDGVETNSPSAVEADDVRLTSIENGGDARSEPPPVLEDGVAPPPVVTHHTEMTRYRTRGIKVAIFMTVLILLSVSNYIGAPMWVISVVSAFFLFAYDLYLVRADGASALSFLHQISERMPWSIGPFVFCMFTMVRVLTETGLTGRFAYWMIKMAGTSSFTQSLAFAYISGILVNCLNDLPSTVFWSDMVSLFCQHYVKESYTVVIMSLLIGVNCGCYLTLIGALAGLMWSNIIRTQPAAASLKVPTGYDLTYYGLMVWVPVTFFCCVAITLVGLAL